MKKVYVIQITGCSPYLNRFYDILVFSTADKARAEFMKQVAELKKLVKKHGLRITLEWPRCLVYEGDGNANTILMTQTECNVL